MSAVAKQWKAPKAAHHLTHILDALAAAGGYSRFPVDVKELALGCAPLFQWSDPIAQVEPANIRGFEGALFPKDSRKSWLLLYNDALRSSGRIRFTQAHELGHYILHRMIRDSFECTEADMLHWSLDDQDLEAQADVFASYLLMPLPDYRQQVSGVVDLELMGHCADRYGVSLTAAILKWLSYTDEKAVVVMSVDGYMKWAWSSTPAFKAGAFYRTRSNTIAIPAGTLTADDAVKVERKGVNVPVALWFSHTEPQMHLREMKLYSDHYDVVMTLLVLPRAASAWPPREVADD